MKYLISITFLLILTFTASAQESEIYTFSTRQFFPIKDIKVTIDQDLLKISAVDAAQNIDTTITGRYHFAINGLLQDLNFKQGLALIPASQGANVLYIKYSDSGQPFKKLYASLSGLVVQISGILFWILIALVGIICYYIGKIVRIVLFVAFVFVALKFGLGIDWHSYLDVLMNALSMKL